MADHVISQPDAGPLALSDRPVGPAAAKVLVSEVARHPGPKTVLVIGAGAGDAVVDRVLAVLMPGDHAIVVAEGPADELLAAAATLAGRVSVRKDLPTDVSELPGPVDVAVVARPVLHPTVVDRVRPLLATDGVLAVATDATGGDPLTGVVDDYAVRTDRVFRSFPPLRVHQLRFAPAKMDAVRIAPGRDPV